MDVGDEFQGSTRRTTQDTAGSAWLTELYEHFAPVRQEAIDAGYSDEAMNGFIDQAVAEVRQKQPPPSENHP